MNDIGITSNYVFNVYPTYSSSIPSVLPIIPITAAKRIQIPQTLPEILRNSVEMLSIPEHLPQEFENWFA